MILNFRAWHKNEKYLGNVDIVDLKNNQVNIVGADIAGLDDVEMMQSTGMKDKNGVEIFEGDYLKNTHTGLIRRVYWSFHHSSFHLSTNRNEGAKNSYWSLSNPKWSYEVIGNIFQNPDLFEKSQHG